MDYQLRQKQKLEAIERLKMLALHPSVLNNFTKYDKVYYSERQNAIFDGVLFEIENDSHYAELVKEFETEYNALVYHAQLCKTEFGTCLSLLYVSSHEDEWELDRSDILHTHKDGTMRVIARVENLTDPYLSECGFIGIVRKNGGVSRVY